MLSALLTPFVLTFVITSPTLSVAAIGTDHAHSQGRVIYADRYSNFATALAAAAGNTLVINTAMVVETEAVVTATTKLRFEGSGQLQKAGSGIIRFQGLGLLDAKSRRPAFSGFAVGDITWTGTDYPKELSLELWDTNNTSLSDRLEHAAAAFNNGGKVVKFIAFPRLITKSVELFDNQSIHFTAGDYANTVTGYPSTPPPFLLNDHCHVTADPGAFLYESNSPTNAHMFAAKMMYVPGADGTVEDIQIRDLYIKGHPLQRHNGASSTIIIGNARNSSVRNVVLDGTHAYGITVGGYSTANNYAENVEVTDIKTLNTGTQLVNVINGKNITFRDIQIDLRNHNSSASFVAIDIEPNTTDNKVENITVENVVVDARTTIPGVYMSAVAMQAAGAAQLVNPVVRNIRVLGRDVSTDGSSGGFLYTAVAVWGAVGGVIEKVYVQGPVGQAFLVQASRQLKLRDLDVVQCSSASGFAVELQSCAECEVDGVSLKKSSTPFRQYTNIKESEVEYTVTASGSKVSETNPGGYPRFYNHFTGLKVVLNNTPYTISAVNNITFSITTTVPVGTLAVKTFASETNIDTRTDVITIPSHGHKTGSKVKYTTGSATVGGLTNGSTYFVITLNSNTLKLATSLANALAGTAIDLTSTGTGSQTLTPVLVTRFSSNRYRNTKADDGILLESTGTSVVDAGTSP
ncbi:MAG TPA: hypothetical protein VJS64_04100 [Pyrinomonadaceae bacterium]|nr:hypothetical protein [Pyrinomonadaceae bacterium]